MHALSIIFLAANGYIQITSKVHHKSTHDLLSMTYPKCRRTLRTKSRVLLSLLDVSSTSADGSTDSQWASFGKGSSGLQLDSLRPASPTFKLHIEGECAALLLCAVRHSSV